MANAEGITPSRHEVERQLDRLLDDEVIASHPQAAKLLRFIVERTLTGEEITEKLIREGVFPNPPYKIDSNIARVTMDTVRKLVKKYYVHEGEHDPVVVTLPESGKGRKRVKFQAGEAYTPQFSYNPASWIAKELAVAYYLLRGSPAQIGRALEHFTNVHRAEPDHPQATLGLIEAWGTILMIGGTPDPDRALSTALLSMLDATEKQDGASWQTHSLRALLLMFRGDLKKARSEFGKALKLDRPATVRSGWYVNFLFRTGHEEQALRLLSSEADERADRAPVHALHGVYLATAHRHEEAQRAFEKSLRLDRNCWLAHFGLTKMYLALGETAKADEHLGHLEALVEPLEFQYVK